MKNWGSLSCHPFPPGREALNPHAPPPLPTVSCSGQNALRGGAVDLRGRALEVDVGTSHGPCPERGDRAWAWGSRGSERGPGFRLWHRQRSQRRRPGCPLGLSFWLSCSWYGIYLSFISRLQIMLSGVFSLFTKHSTCVIVFGLIILSDSYYKIIPRGPKHNRNENKHQQLLPDPPRPSTLCVSSGTQPCSRVRSPQGGLRPRGNRVLCMYLFARASRASVLTTVKSRVRRGRPVA